MKFEELSEEEAAGLDYGRPAGNPGAYDGLMAAVRSGKRVKVLLEGKQEVKNLKWALSRAAKREGLKLDIRVLADRSGVVVSVPVAAPVHTQAAPPPPAPAPAAAPAGTPRTGK